MALICSPHCIPLVSSSSSCQVSTPLSTLGTPRVLHLIPGSTLCSPRPHGWYCPPVPPDGIHNEEEISEDFRGLYAEVKVHSIELESLAMELRQKLLSDIGRLLQDQPGMEVLEASVSERVGGGQGLPKPARPHLPHPYLS